MKLNMWPMAVGMVAGAALGAFAINNMSAGTKRDITRKAKRTIHSAQDAIHNIGH